MRVEIPANLCRLAGAQHVVELCVEGAVTQRTVLDALEARYPVLRGTIRDHGTLERRPFVGFHPLYPVVGILNGMGTKGCSLAPFFARQLVRHIMDGSAILAEADVRRFSKILSR